MTRIAKSLFIERRASRNSLFNLYLADFFYANSGENTSGDTRYYTWKRDYTLLSAIYKILGSTMKI